MSTDTKIIESLVEGEYKWGFVTEVQSDSAPKGLNEDTIRLISAKKNEPEFMLEWRLKAFRHWLKLEKQEAEPKWANIKYDAIDYQDIIYYSAPKPKKAGPKSLDEVDPEILLAYEKLGLRWMSRSGWPALRWTRCSTASPWLRHFRPSSLRSALSSARSRRRCSATPHW